MEQEAKSAKHLYSRGWLGLIPLIGGFAGLYLILLGIFKYRDRKLIIIGVAALLFTVLIYSSIYYYFNYSTQARKDFSVFAQPAMDNLIKDIEFYKTDHGAYPDVLKQIITEDKFASIHDPIPGKQEINNGEFYYKKLDRKYYLFSSGIDKVPFTTDDIYPSSKYYDSTKTGLIRPAK
jgi:hypothetical protein